MGAWSLATATRRRLPLVGHGRSRGGSAASKINLDRDRPSHRRRGAAEKIDFLKLSVVSAAVSLCAVASVPDRALSPADIFCRLPPRLSVPAVKSLSADYGQ